MCFSKESMPPLPNPDTVLSVTAALNASAFLFHSLVNDIVPDVVHEFFSTRIQKISACLSSQLTVVIEEYDGFTPNQMFKAANVYLGSKLTSSTKRIKVNWEEKEKGLSVTLDKNQELTDVFEGMKLKWVLVSSNIVASSAVSNKKCVGNI